MHITLSYQSDQPIYEQIKYQIRAQILSGEIEAGTMLPSIRTLAKELKIGIITAKRAYDDLCGEGFLYSAQGKGVFVSEAKKEDLAAYKAEKIKNMFNEIKKYAEEHGVDKKTLEDIFRQISGE